jgi:hypothetical protein
MADASEQAALRLRATLEELLDRHADTGEAARSEALVRSLRHEAAALPGKSKAAVLTALRALYPDDPTPAASAGGTSATQRRLEQEIARLRDALAEARAAAGAAAAAAPAQAPPPAPAGEFARRMASVLVGGADAAAGPEAEERIAGIVGVLQGFAAGLARTYLGATAEPDRTMAGHFQAVLADEIAGRRPAGSVEALLEQIRRQIGAQLVAFREACDAGAQNLLKQISPHAVADGAKEGVKFAGMRPFWHRECWERFEARWEDLRTSDNLYETYFDGAFRRALLR